MILTKKKCPCGGNIVRRRLLGDTNEYCLLCNRPAPKEEE